MPRSNLRTRRARENCSGSADPAAGPRSSRVAWLAAVSFLGVAAALAQPTPQDLAAQDLQGEDRPPEVPGLATFSVSPADATLRMGSLEALGDVLWGIAPPGSEPDEPAKLAAVALLSRSSLPTPTSAVYTALGQVEVSAPAPLVAGGYLLQAARPGYRPATTLFTVEAGKVAKVTVDLERTSTVLRLRTDPSDARISIDGIERGRTVGPAERPRGRQSDAAQDSREFWIAGIPSGQFELEVARPGFRTYEATLQLPELRDYVLPAIALERELAAIGFPRLPTDTVVTANGLPVQPDYLKTPPEVHLPPGRYDLTVTQGTSGYFETSVLAKNRRRVDVEVDLRPALAFLGVLDSEPAATTAVHAGLDAFRDEGSYTVVSRARTGATVFRESGIDGSALRRWSDSAEQEVDWAAFRARVENALPAALYLAAVGAPAFRPTAAEGGQVPSNEQDADQVHLWWWAAAPGPSRPDVRTVPIQDGRLDPDALTRLVRALRPETARRTPSTGATVIDSLAFDGPVVAAVEPGSPAAQAGLEAGMEIASLRTTPDVEQDDWSAAVAALRPNDILEVWVESENGAPAAHRIEPTWGWTTQDPFHPELLTSAAAAHLTRELKRSGDIPRWLLELDLASILLARGDVEEAVRRLRMIEAPRRGGLGHDTVQYLIALGLTELAEQQRPEYRDQATVAFRDLEFAERSRLRSDDGPSIAARARLHAKTSLALIPPDNEIVVGEYRAEVLTTGGDIVAVRFLVDGKVQTTQAGPQSWATLRLTKYPTQQVVRVEGLGADGKVLASDELVLNQQRGDLRVRVEEPPAGIDVSGAVQARASVVVPKDRTIGSVEFRVGEEVQAVLQRPPWQTEIEVPAAAGDATLVYLTVTAILDDGSSAEEVRILSSAAVIEHVEVDLVELYITVVDQGNRPITGLTDTAFAVFEDGNRQQIARFELVEDLPLTIGVAIDTSASMEDVLDEARSAAAQFLTNLVRPTDSSFAVAFASRPHLLTGRTSDVRAVVDTLRGLRAGGSTSLHDALMTGLYYFRGVRGRRAMILLSDGEDTSSTAQYADVLEYARQSEVVIYTIGLGVGRTEEFLRQKLEEIAQATGGRAFFIAAAKDLKPVYRQIERELRSQYLLAYTSNQEGPGEAFRQVEVRVGGGYRARTISGYYP